MLHVFRMQEGQPGPGMRCAHLVTDHVACLLGLAESKRSGPTSCPVHGRVPVLRRCCWPLPPRTRADSRRW